MNSKMIAIIAVVAMCGAALVGVGYAYTAEIINGGNTVTADADYITISMDSSSSYNTSLAWQVDVEYNYKNDMTAESNKIQWTGGTVITPVKKIVKVEIDPSKAENSKDKNFQIAVSGISNSTITPSDGTATISAASVSVNAFSAEVTDGEGVKTYNTPLTKTSEGIFDLSTMDNTKVIVYLEFTLTATPVATLYDTPADSTVVTLSNLDITVSEKGA